MGFLIPGSKRKKFDILEAPPWVAGALQSAEPLGAGSYAWTWRVPQRGRVLKITQDDATRALAASLLRKPCLGLPRVDKLKSITILERGQEASACALLMEELFELSPAQHRLVEKAYNSAKRRATEDEDPLARSLSLLEELKKEVPTRFSTQPHLVAALDRLIAHLRYHRHHIDLMHPSNWMQDASGKIVLSDPVVWYAMEF